MQFIEPWSPYAGRTSIISSGRRPLTSAFGDLVSCRAGFPPHELPGIFRAPEDEGENDAIRDLVRLRADHLAATFVTGRLQTFARPLGGGEAVAVDALMWELDDPLPRFATGAFNLEQWWDAKALPTHRLFVDAKEFDRWLAALKPLGFLTNQQVEEIVDPQKRAARAVAAENIAANHPEDTDRHDRPVHSDPPGAGPILLDIKEVSELIKRSRSTIYKMEAKGEFPEPLKLGASTRWKRDEVVAWIEEQAARRGN